MEITLLNTIGYALVNAINPCAIAALVTVLISILLANENNRKKVLWGGFSFVLAVFIGYSIYGLIIIQLFKGFSVFASSVEIYLKYFLGFLAIILGLLNIKDYLNYRPGGIATETPLSFRPRMKLMIQKITSPLGAFFVGIFVTLFLLPCTMGPYIIALGKVYNLSFLAIVPHVLLFNLIFMIPMVIVIFIVYWGLTSAERVAEWKERNIKRIHLTAGVILILLGIAMVTGII